MDIERLDRDDVFRKSNKFDRPDFGNNIPFELFSALSSLHMSHKQEQEKQDSYPHEEQDFKTDDHDEDHEGEAEELEDKKPDTETETDIQEEEIEEKHHDKAQDEVTIDTKTVTENPPDSQERVVPQEFEVRLRHSRSIELQVIETRQDQDLIQEREEAKHLKEEEEHKKAEEEENKKVEEEHKNEEATETKPEESTETPKEEASQPTQE